MSQEALNPSPRSAPPLKVLSGEDTRRYVIALIVLIVAIGAGSLFVGVKGRALAEARLSQSLNVLLNTQGAGVQGWIDSRRSAADALASDPHLDPAQLQQRAAAGGFTSWRLEDPGGALLSDGKLPRAAMALEASPGETLIRLIPGDDGPLLVAVGHTPAGDELRLAGGAQPLIELIRGPTLADAPAEAFLYDADGRVLAAGDIANPLPPEARVPGDVDPDDPLQVKVPHEGVRGNLVLDNRAWLESAQLGLLVQVREADAYPLLSLGSLAFIAGLSMFVVFGLAVAGMVALNRLIRRRVASAIAKLGQYQLDTRIGEGAMGTVWRAHHAMLQRPTAVKLIRGEDANEEDLARFGREVQLTSRLTHPNTVAIYDFGRSEEGVFYYAMEYLPGITLEDLVAAVGPLEPARVIHLLRQAAGSLAEAHDAGLIHRDVKPANLMLCPRGGMHDVVKVLDFGLVKEESSGESGLTQRGTILGTPHYMAPEAVVSPDRIDGRADIYSLAAVGYWLLTGTTLFADGPPMEVCVQQVTRPPEPPSVRRGSPIGDDLEVALMRALQKEPGLRPRTAREFVRELDACAEAFTWSQRLAAAWWEDKGEGLLPDATGYTKID